MTHDAGVFAGNLDWLVLRSPALNQQAADIEARVIAIAQTTCGAPQARHLAELSTWLGAEEQKSPGTARKIRDTVKADTTVAELIGTGAIHNIAAALAGGPVRLHDILRFRTVMQTLEFTRSRPHQDAALWPDNPNHVNVWVALCDVTEELAPLQIVPGSGRSLRRHVENEYQQFEVEGFDETREVPEKIPVKYGEVIFFSPRSLHYSAPNLTNMVRWSLDFRFSRIESEG